MKLGSRIADRLTVLGWRQRDLLDALPDLFPQAPPPADRNGLYAVDHRLSARPPLTDEENDLLDGYRLADETDQKQMLGLALIAKSRKGKRDGEHKTKQA